MLVDTLCVFCLQSDLGDNDTKVGLLKDGNPVPPLLQNEYKLEQFVLTSFQRFLTSNLVYPHWKRESLAKSVSS